MVVWPFDAQAGDDDRVYYVSEGGFHKNVTVERGMSVSSYLWSGEQYVNHKVIEGDLSTRGTTPTGESFYAWWMMNADMTKFGYSQAAFSQLVAANDTGVKKEFTLTFDYYVSAEAGTDVYLCPSDTSEIGAPGGWSNYVRGNKKLAVGVKRNFTMVMKNTVYYDVRPYIRADAEAKIYIWNLRIVHNGVVYDDWENGTDNGSCINYVASNGGAANFNFATAKSVTTMRDFTRTGTTVEQLPVPTNEGSAKVFVGWVDENGKPYNKTDLVTEAHVLNEQWYDFYTMGAQIRTAADNPGLRFRVGIDPKFAETFSDLKRYVVLIPESVRVNSQNGNHTLTDGAVFTYNGVEYPASTQECAYYYSPAKDVYTLVVVKNSAYLNRVYAARGMLTFTDLNGIKKTVYTSDDSLYTKDTGVMARSYNQVEDYVTGGGSLDGLTTTTTTTTRKAVTTTKWSSEKDNYLNQSKTAIYGSTTDMNRYIYQLGGSEGVTVREVTIPSNRGGAAVEIVQITDSHLTLTTAEEASSSNRLYTQDFGWKHRQNTFTRGQANLERCLNYAKYFDYTVLSGDVIDFTSYGNLNYVKNNIFGKYSNIMMAVGNHDAHRDVANADTWSFEARYAAVQSAAKNDLQYSSVVVNDKVVVVQFDNNYEITQATINKLQQDINLARENNYTILLFAHEPLVSDNPAETDVEALANNRTNDNKYVMNFYQGYSYNYGDANKTADYHEDFFGGDHRSGNEKAIWKMITTNADVIGGFFSGHWHANHYSEVIATTHNGKQKKIPQYILTGSYQSYGSVMRIKVQ